MSRLLLTLGLTAVSAVVASFVWLGFTLVVYGPAVARGGCDLAAIAPAVFEQPAIKQMSASIADTCAALRKLER